MISERMMIVYLLTAIFLGIVFIGYYIWIGEIFDWLGLPADGRLLPQLFATFLAWNITFHFSSPKQRCKLHDIPDYRLR